MTGMMRMGRRLISQCSSASRAAVAFAIAGTINGGSALGDCKLLQLAQLPVTVSDNRPLIDGEINGQKIKILVDTGSENTMIWRSEAMRLGLPLQEVRGVKMFGVGGETRVQSATTHEFKLAEFTTHGSRFLVAGEGRNDAFSVVLGEDILSKMAVEFDLAHGAMRLFRPQGCKPEQLMYWNAPSYSAAPLVNPPSHTLRISIAVELNGKRVIATLDSGANRSVVSTGAAANAGVRIHDAEGKGEVRARGVGARPVGLTVAKFDSIAIGDETIKNPQLQVGDFRRDMRMEVTGSRLEETLHSAPYMLLGADFLLSHRILIPLEGPIVVFTYAGGPVFQSVHDVSPAVGDSTGAADQAAAPTNQKKNKGSP